MRVAFDSRPAGETHAIGRYSRCLLEALRETAEPGAEVYETHRPRRAQVFHSPWIDGALLHSPCPMVVTLHEVSKLERRSEHLRTGVRPRLRQLAVQRAVRVIVTTEELAQDACERLGIEREQIDVIHEAAAASMRPRPAHEVAAARASLGLPEDYLLCVGGLQHPDPGNHLARLAATPRELPLVLVGPASRWAHELPDVTVTDEVSDEQLAALYSGARALVVTSEADGFPLPAVEALACGTPVVACDVPALREVLDGRARFVPRGDLDALMETAQAMQRPAPSPSAWSWQDVAEATWRVYERAVAQASERCTAGRGRSRRATAASARRAAAQ